MSSYDSFLLRLIDKTNSTPTGITEGGLIAGDISPYFFRAELLHSIVNRTANVSILLVIPESGIFATAAPKLLDQDAQDKYYIEARIEQSGNFTKLFRLRIGQPTLYQDDSVSNAIKVPVVGIEYVAREFPSSRQDKFETPKQHFINLLSEYNGNRGGDGPILNHVPANIEYPDTEGSRRNWETFAPVMLQDRFKEVNDTQVEPGAVGGTYTDMYIDYFPSASTTKQVDVEVRKFGTIDSGVDIDAETLEIPGTPEAKTGISEQLKRKNLIIYKYHPAGGSIPMEKTRFESNFLHAKLRPEWSASKSYVVGDLVKFTHTSETPNVIRYFKAVAAVGPTATTPDADDTNWLEDFTIIPNWNADAFYKAGSIVTRKNAGNTEHWRADNAVGPTPTPPELDGGNWTQVFTARISTMYTDFVTYTPHTNDLPTIEETLYGQSAIPAGYKGFVPDWNMIRALYDKVDYTSDFKHVSGRSVRGQQNAPPTGRELFHFSEWLVGTSPTGAWAGQANKIARYDRLPDSDPTNPKWVFSDAPVEGDTIFNEDRAEIWAYQSGVWGEVWNVNDDNLKSSPYHLVKDIRLVEGRSGIPGQAVELRFDWDPVANVRNRSSRGAWYYEELPYPRLDTSTTNLGAIYGGDGTNFPPNAFFNSVHLDSNRKGIVGWNRGLDSEDMGRVSSHVIAINVGFFRSTDDTILTKGKANIPFLYFRRDLFGRVYYHEFTVPRNAQWHLERVPIPPAAPPTQLYHNRLDELSSILGYTIPFTFGLPEKEFSGVQFDERFAKGWGVMLKEAYTNEGMYIGNYDFLSRSITEAAQQIFPDILELIDKVQQGDWDNIAFTEADADTDHVKLAIDNLYYEKEGYALSQDSEVSEPRIEIIREESETDYNNAKLKARAFEERRFQVLQNWHFKTAGDVRMMPGQTFDLVGSEIPGGPLTLVCQEVKHIIDNDKGYFMEVFAILKRTVPI